MGLNLNDMYPSRWLKAEDFAEGENKVLTIKDVRYETLGQGAKAEDKPVVEFREAKPLVLNKTNAHIIGQLYGSDTDEWLGKKVSLFTMEVDSFGDIVRAIRVRNSVPTQAAQIVPARQPGDGRITADQKKLLIEEANRTQGEDKGIAFVKSQLGDVNNSTYQEAGELIIWLQTQPTLTTLVADNVFDDSDPFADD